MNRLTFSRFGLTLVLVMTSFLGMAKLNNSQLLK